MNPFQQSSHESKLNQLIADQLTSIKNVDMKNENNKPDNPNAFPVDGVYAGESLSKGNAGMSLRDYFAAKALNGTADMGVNHEAETAKRAYKIADAMLKEREL